MYIILQLTLVISPQNELYVVIRQRNYTKATRRKWKETGSCLNPKLPETWFAGRGGKWPGRPSPGKKKSIGIQQRWGNHEKRQRGIHSERDEGGSAPNSVRKFVAPGFNNSEEVTRSALIYLLFSFLQENKSFGVQPFALILCQYVADIAYETLMFNTINVSPSNHLREQ